MDLHSCGSGQGGGFASKVIGKKIVATSADVLFSPLLKMSMGIIPENDVYLN